MEDYEIIGWPDIQAFMDLEGFDENATLIEPNSSMGIESSTYLVDKDWLESIEENDKKSISQEQAEQMLLSYIDNNEFGDRLYEFVQDLCNKVIRDIESKFIVVDIDGTPYTDSDDVMWYDECRDEFMKAVFEKIRAGQF